MRNQPVSVWRKPATLACLCLLLQSTQATQLFQESFNYTPSGDLAGNGTWLHDYSYIKVGANSLTYPSLVDTSPSGYEVSVLDNPSAGSSTTAFYTYSPFTSVSLRGMPRVCSTRFKPPYRLFCQQSNIRSQCA